MAAQPETYLGVCEKHFTERAVDRCSDCGGLYCSECLVPPTRKRMPIRCVGCALIAAGVRSPGAKRTGMSTLSRAQHRPTSRW